MPLQLHLRPGTPPWSPQSTALNLIGQHVQRPVRASLWRREDLDAAWRSTHKGKAPPNFPPYAFRAWAEPSTGETVILVDETETPASVTWLLLHELAHHELRTSPLVAGALGMARKPRDYMTSDDAHQEHPEERMADWIATLWYKRLGFGPPYRLDRRWWRRRVMGRR